MLIDPDDEGLSIRKQCDLLSLNRSNLYYEKVEVSEEILRLMHRIDEIHTEYPFFGSRKIAKMLSIEDSIEIGRGKVRGLMEKMGLEAIYPKKNLSKRRQEHKVYPYLLRDIEISYPNQVWSSDITYIRLEGGFAYLVAIIDWYSRYVLSWRLSNSLDTAFCIDALEDSFTYGCPEIFNTDQGCQFTSVDFTQCLLDRDIRISMDGKGRALDNIFIERLWRSLKYEDIYLKNYCTIIEAERGIERYFNFYNWKRPHQSLSYQTPKDIYLN